MLLESDKNKVYFSSLFARHYKDLYSAIRIILKAEGIACETISGTKDYWCRDYMPVQADRQSFAQFMYHPDYLELMREYETNVDEVIAASFPDLDISSAPIIADGGNFVAAVGRDRKKCVIMTMKTRCENNDLHPGAPVPFVSFVENVVKSSLKCDNVVTIPWDREDDLGHVDGIVRFAGFSPRGIPRVLVNRKLYSQSYASAVKNVLSEHFQVVDLKLSSYDELSWAYINAIQTSRCIIVPGIGLPTDDEALKQYEELYPEYAGHIYMVQMREFIKEWNGALNCLSWTIKSPEFCKFAYNKHHDDNDN